jgi:hypothetical protein
VATTERASGGVVGGLPGWRDGSAKQAISQFLTRVCGGDGSEPEADYLDDGPQKPIRIWSRTGRRPLLATGNSNGDVPMLHFTQQQDKPFLRLLILHDDGEREFAYTTGAEQALAQATRDDWTVISIKNDWATVF